MHPSLIAATVGILTAGVAVSTPTAHADRGSEVTLAGPASPRAAALAVVLGQSSGGNLGSCGPGPFTLVQSVEAGAPTYSVPGPGVITSFSHLANAQAGSVRAVVFGPSAAPNTRSILATTAPLPVVPGLLNTFAVRIPVPAGVAIGLTTMASNMACSFLGTSPGDQNLYQSMFDSASATQMTGFPLAAARVNVSAVWETDADGDGFGDVTQDACPDSALTQAVCTPPDTTITKQPSRRSTKRKVKIAFTSEPGSTSTCATDGGVATPCTSPFKKKLGYGKHVVLITATSRFGIVEVAPATVRFKVVKKKA